MSAGVPLNAQTSSRPDCNNHAFGLRLGVGQGEPPAMLSNQEAASATSVLQWSSDVGTYGCNPCFPASAAPVLRRCGRVSRGRRKASGWRFFAVFAENTTRLLTQCRADAVDIAPTRKTFSLEVCVANLSTNPLTFAFNQRFGARFASCGFRGAVRQTIMGVLI